MSYKKPQLDNTGDSRATLLIIDGRRCNDVRVTTEPVYTLEARMGTGGNNVPIIAFGIDGYNQTISDGVYHTIDARTHKGDDLVATEKETMQVRRLTPIECERLMGWPDNHTLPRSDGKQNPDTTRYKMCGNGVASPVAQWIGQHLMAIMNDQ